MSRSPKLSTPDNSSAVRDALHGLARDWDTPTFDAGRLVAQGRARAHRHRARVVGVATTVTVLVAGGTVGLAVAQSRSAVGSQVTSSPDESRPAISPPVRVTALDRTGQHIDHEPVLLRLAAGTPATIRARLHFLVHRPIKLIDVALIVARPGAEPGVGGKRDDSYVRPDELARSHFITIDQPVDRTISVATPHDLPPGTYPVFVVMEAVSVPGSTYDPLSMLSDLGVIVVSAR